MLPSSMPPIGGRDCIPPTSPRHQVRLLRQAHESRRSHRSTAPLAANAQPHSTQPRTATNDSMNPGSFRQHRPSSQRPTLARKSTPSRLKTRPDHPTFDTRSALPTVKRSALLTCSHRAAAKILPNAGINPEANRISTTRFDGVRP
jgi:hypothetical protein